MAMDLKTPASVARREAPKSTVRRVNASPTPRIVSADMAVPADLPPDGIPARASSSAAGAPAGAGSCDQAVTQLPSADRQPEAASRRKDKAWLDGKFTQLYRAHLRDVYSYSYYRVGNHHDAEDLTTQTFIQAYRHFDRALRESEGRPLRPWLIRIAHNLAANYYRDRARRPQTPIDDAGPLAILHTTESLVEQRDDLARILRCVQQLPEDRREAVIMRFALGMDNREIARALARSDGATKVLLHRAVRQLEGLVAAEESV